MNDFEKTLIIDYMVKLLPYTDLDGYNFDDVFDFIVSEFKLDKSKFILKIHYLAPSDYKILQYST